MIVLETLVQGLDVNMCGECRKHPLLHMFHDIPSGGVRFELVCNGDCDKRTAGYRYPDSAVDAWNRMQSK